MKVELRKLTRRSTVGFGNYKELTVQQLMDLGKRRQITDMYFRLSRITFTDDILEWANITEDFRIEKPGKCLETKSRWIEWRRHVRENNLDNLTEDERIRRYRAGVYGKKIRNANAYKNIDQARSFFNKDRDRRYNHGHDTKKK